MAGFLRAFRRQRRKSVDHGVASAMVKSVDEAAALRSTRNTASKTAASTASRRNSQAAAANATTTISTSTTNSPKTNRKRSKGNQYTSLHPTREALPSTASHATQRQGQSQSIVYSQDAEEVFAVLPAAADPSKPKPIAPSPSFFSKFVKSRAKSHFSLEKDTNHSNYFVSDDNFGDFSNDQKQQNGQATLVVGEDGFYEEVIVEDDDDDGSNIASFFEEVILDEDSSIYEEQSISDGEYQAYMEQHRPMQQQDDNHDDEDDVSYDEITISSAEFESYMHSHSPLSIDNVEDKTTKQEALDAMVMGTDVIVTSTATGKKKKHVKRSSKPKTEKSPKKKKKKKKKQKETKSLEISPSTTLNSRKSLISLSGSFDGISTGVISVPRSSKEALSSPDIKRRSSIRKMVVKEIRKDHTEESSWQAFSSPGFLDQHASLPFLDVSNTEPSQKPHFGFSQSVPDLTQGWSSPKSVGTSPRSRSKKAKSSKKTKKTDSRKKLEVSSTKNRPTLSKAPYSDRLLGLYNGDKSTNAGRSASLRNLHINTAHYESFQSMPDRLSSKQISEKKTKKKKKPKTPTAKKAGTTPVSSPTPSPRRKTRTSSKRTKSVSPRKTTTTSKAETNSPSTRSLGLRDIFGLDGHYDTMKTSLESIFEEKSGNKGKTKQCNKSKDLSATTATTGSDDSVSLLSPERDPASLPLSMKSPKGKQHKSPKGQSSKKQAKSKSSGTYGMKKLERLDVKSASNFLERASNPDNGSSTFHILDFLPDVPDLEGSSTSLHALGEDSESKEKWTSQTLKSAGQKETPRKVRTSPLSPSRRGRSAKSKNGGSNGRMVSCSTE